MAKQNKKLIHMGTDPKFGKKRTHDVYTTMERRHLSLDEYGGKNQTRVSRFKSGNPRKDNIFKKRRN